MLVHGYIIDIMVCLCGLLDTVNTVVIKVAAIQSKKKIFTWQKEVEAGIHANTVPGYRFETICGIVCFVNTKVWYLRFYFSYASNNVKMIVRLSHSIW